MKPKSRVIHFSLNIANKSLFVIEPNKKRDPHVSIIKYKCHTKLGSQSDLMDKAKWTDEASAVYK